MKSLVINLLGNRWATAGLLIAILTVIGQFLAFSPVGISTFLLPKALSLLILMALALIVAALTVLLPVDLIRKLPVAPRLQRIASVLACAALVFAGLWMSPMARDVQLGAFAERSSPVIGAIRSYIADNGVPPDSLGSLVPEYLREMPSTGMGAFPEFVYHPIGAVGTSWALSVAVPTMPMDFDQIWYLPEGSYPELDAARGVSIGNWLFFDD